VKEIQNKGKKPLRTSKEKILIVQREENEQKDDDLLKQHQPRSKESSKRKDNARETEKDDSVNTTQFQMFLQFGWANINVVDVLQSTRKLDKQNTHPHNSTKVQALNGLDKVFDFLIQFEEIG